MDRDNRWERVRKAYLAIAEADAPRFSTPDAVLAKAYAENVSDEFVHPAVIAEYARLRDGDGLLSFNFRADRVRQIITALVDPQFDRFVRPRAIRFAAKAGMTQYSEDLDQHLLTLFSPQKMTGLLGEVVARAGFTQVRMAETEKYPHVTYFLNGGQEKAYPGEERILVPSPKVATYDLKPEMAAGELTDEAVISIASGKFDLIMLNFANPDMVGHTGKLDAAIKAVQTVDTCLGRTLEAIGKCGGTVLVTADHGNCEMMRDPATGAPHTSHTTNPVPIILQANLPGAQLHDGRLADVAPTLLHLMDLAQPPEMTGTSLVVTAEIGISEGPLG
jgi:2,3-bisphosphoglycerate-independent phosphoglycerate mutase